MRVSKAYVSILLAFSFLTWVNAVNPQTQSKRSPKKTAQQSKAQTAATNLDDNCKPDTPAVPVVPVVEAVPPAGSAQTSAPTAPSQSAATKQPAAPCVPGEVAAPPAAPAEPAQATAAEQSVVPVVPAKPCDTGPEYCWERKLKGKIPSQKPKP